jgi:hypothetical protein
MHRTTRDPRPRAAALAALAFATLGGCAAVGPKAIEFNRLQYNEIVSTTASQEALLNIVRIRYGERTQSLTVASITASPKIHVDSRFELGIGPSEIYKGNLVPFSGGFYYEENPTISYVPVQGAKYLTQISAPIPLHMLVPLLRNAVTPGLTLTMLVQRVNDIRNPAFQSATGTSADPRFARVVALLDALSTSGDITWVARDAEGKEFAMVIAGYSPSETAQVQELLELLGETRAAGGDRVVLNLSLTVGEPVAGELNLATRSVVELINMLAAGTEVSSEDVASGAAARYPPLGPSASALHVHQTAERPPGASVAVKYRDRWYSIADADQVTKRTFYSMLGLWSAVMADAVGPGSTAPLLTIPVSR